MPRSKYLTIFFVLLALYVGVTVWLNSLEINRNKPLLIHARPTTNPYSATSTTTTKLRISGWPCSKFGSKTHLPNINSSLVEGWQIYIDQSTSPPKQMLWPEETDGDRIRHQLMFIPPELEPINDDGFKLKRILLLNTTELWTPSPPGRDIFLKDGCLVNTCTITFDENEFENSDAVIFSDGIRIPSRRRSPNQVWVLFLLESPFLTQDFNLYRSIFNWTATYRSDSDIQIPYSKFFHYDRLMAEQDANRNFAANKTAKVAWFVSDCTSSNQRLLYALQLQKFIDVDIYGECLGNNTCTKSNFSGCLDMLRNNYKFYLSFENANCKEFITEAFYLNGLSSDVIPVVLGARKQDYKLASPPHSFIYAEDFNSPKELAHYLLLLDVNDNLYNEYFHWKKTKQPFWVGDYGVDSSATNNLKFWCRLCGMLHAKIPTKTYDDMNEWWRGPGVCAKGERMDETNYLTHLNRNLKFQGGWLGE